LAENVEYVKGPEPDRWHWQKDCTQYPRVAVRKRFSRPNSDLCDECEELERIGLRKMAMA